jgi:hypothetical protein
MGYAYYTLADGREAGYGVDSICDENGCTEKIDRGLWYLCGETPGDNEHGCGGYFCGEHLLMGYMQAGKYHSAPHQMCPRCFDQWSAAQPTSSEPVSGD